jgi:hypothetical protein
MEEEEEAPDRCIDIEGGVDIEGQEVIPQWSMRLGDEL